VLSPGIKLQGHNSKTGMHLLLIIYPSYRPTGQMTVLRVTCSAECAARRSRCRGRRPCENVFAGRHPLSEPETVAVANFIMRHRSSIRLYLSLHCYSQLWLTPWGYTAEPPVDRDDLVSRQAAPLAYFSHFHTSRNAQNAAYCD